MTDTQQTEALRLADRIKSSGQFTNLEELDAAAAELHRLHAENVALQQCYDAARLEIEALRSCVIDLTVLLFSKSAPARDHPPLPMQFACSGVFPVYSADQMRAYADATCAMRAQAAHAAVAGQCEDAIELLGKYKELCEEIKRGDSYHIGRIDAAISVLAQAAPVAQGDAEDAARWRWLRENWFTMTSSYDQQRIRFKVGEPRRSDIAETELDAAIDAARSHAKEGAKP